MDGRICADCGTKSPETNTQYTLIAKHGWRVVRTGGVGQASIEWRCPGCWASFKSRQPAPPAPPRLSKPPPVSASEESVEAGRMFDRALQALTTKPPNRTR